MRFNQAPIITHLNLVTYKWKSHVKHYGQFFICNAQCMSTLKKIHVNIHTQTKLNTIRALLIQLVHIEADDKTQGHLTFYKFILSSTASVNSWSSVLLKMINTLTDSDISDQHTCILKCRSLFFANVSFFSYHYLMSNRGKMRKNCKRSTACWW